MLNTGKVELPVDTANTRHALDNFNFDYMARTSGVSVNQIKNALLTAATNRMVSDARPSCPKLIFAPQIVEFTPGILKFNYEEVDKLEKRGQTILEPYKSNRKCVKGFVWSQVCHLFMSHQWR
jgi:hypothetical protein